MFNPDEALSFKLLRWDSIVVSNAHATYACHTSGSTGQSRGIRFYDDYVSTNRLALSTFLTMAGRGAW